MRINQTFIKNSNFLKPLLSFQVSFLASWAVSRTIGFTFLNKISKIQNGSHGINDKNRNVYYQFLGTDNNAESVNLKELFLETLKEFDAEFQTTFEDDYKNGNLKFYLNPTLAPNAFAEESLFRKRESVTITQGMLHALNHKITANPLNDSNDEYETDEEQSNYFKSNYNHNDQINLIEIKKNVLKSILLHELGHLKNNDLKTRMKISYFSMIPLIGDLIQLALPSFLYQKQELKADQATILKNTKKDYSHEMILGLRAMERYVEESRPSSYLLLKYLGRKTKESLSKVYRKLKGFILKRDYNHAPCQKTYPSSYSIPNKKQSFVQRLTRTHPYTETRAQELNRLRRQSPGAA